MVLQFTFAEEEWETEDPVSVHLYFLSRSQGVDHNLCITMSCSNSLTEKTITELPQNSPHYIVMPSSIREEDRIDRVPMKIMVEDDCDLITIMHDGRSRVSQIYSAPCISAGRAN